MPISRVSLAKITRPSFAGLLVRKHLFRRLDEAQRVSSVWISGPPGSGKTTLAASYLEARKLESLWYQFDESDSDIASFFHHLGLAVSECSRRKTPRLPQLTPQHHARLGEFARRYFEALFRRVESPFTLVFDGYHELEPRSALHEIMVLAISMAPPGVSLFVASRGDPPSAMARLRANRRLEAVDWRDLQLTLEESNAIAAVRGRKPDREALNELYARTQGWAAGVILMLEQTRASESNAATADLATPQLVFDYLAGEIFDEADPEVRELMLSTAFLPQMTPAMACAVSGQVNAGECLARLHRDNYFVTLRRAHPEPVYEFHPLMREFMLTRAGRDLARDDRIRLQQCSAELLESEGLIAESGSLLRSTADWDRMCALIRRQARSMLECGRSETVAQWVESLPKEVRERDPWTIFWLAAARMHISPRESRILYEQAHLRFGEKPEVDTRGLLLSCCGAMDAILYEVDDYSLLDRWIDVAIRLLREHPNLVSGPVEARVTCSLFTSLVARQPQHPEIENWGERAYRASVAQDDIGVRMFVEPRIALGIIYGGHFPRAWAIIEAVRRLLDTSEVAPASVVMFRLVEATYFMLTAQRADCDRAVADGLEIERAEGFSVFTHQLLAYGAGGALAAGDTDAADDYLARFAAIPATAARFDLCLFHLFSTWLAMRKEDAVGAYQQQKLALRMAVEVGCPVFEVLCRIAAAYVTHDSGDQRAPWMHLQQVYDISRRIRNHLLEFNGLMAYSYLALASGRRPRSGVRALRYALEIGKPRNYTGFVLWRPAAFARLCSFALEAGIESDFVGRIIRERGLEMDASESGLLDWPWPLHVHTLGRFKVIKSGVPVVFSGKAQRRPLDLLKVVIAHGGRDVSEVRITEALWPRVDGDSAHRSFASALHRLRKLLGEDRVITLSEGKLTLDGRRIWVDTWAFEQVASRIARLLRHPVADTDAEQLHGLTEKLLHIYGGAFLVDEPDEPWNLAFRERTRQRFLRAMADLCQRWQQMGRHGDAVNALERALDIESNAESLYRSLILSYLRLDRRGDAVSTYDRCQKMLALSRNMTPSPETTALLETGVSPD